LSEASLQKFDKLPASGTADTVALHWQEILPLGNMAEKIPKKNP
jgi:hypothetical protein